jgi:hypothetical protein
VRLASKKAFCWVIFWVQTIKNRLYNTVKAVFVDPLGIETLDAATTQSCFKTSLTLFSGRFQAG